MVCTISTIQRSLVRTAAWPLRNTPVSTRLAAVSGSNRRIRWMERDASEIETALKRLVRKPAEPIFIDAMGAAIAAGGAMGADSGKNGKRP